MIQLSIVVAALNAQDNVEPLIEQIKRTVVDCGLGVQLVVVDDGSTDQTLARLKALAARHQWVQVLHGDKPQGQSAALAAGLRQVQGPYVATLDADLQNDSEDLPLMLQTIQRKKADLVQGDRSRHRKDTVVRRGSSWVGRTVRRMVVAEHIHDTGCSARVMTRALAQQLPLQFKGMHRFIPAYAKVLGATIVEVPARHHLRTAGTTNYGIFNRAIPGLIYCLVMRWMKNRYRHPHMTPVEVAKT